MTKSSIPWLCWSPGAFVRAKQENRPILLCLTAPWSLSGQAMDREAWADPGVVRLIAEGYVPLRVDADRRPDLDARYNLGGWPTTAILSDGGELLTGATYAPVEAVRAMLAQVREGWTKDADGLRRQLAERRARHDAVLRERLATLRPVPDDLPDRIVDRILASFDADHGGFGSEPKFPLPDSLDLLLRRQAERRDPQTRDVLTRTLDAMAAGGLRDRASGGFFRSAAGRDWTGPRDGTPEEENAALASVYLDAAAILNDPRHAEVAAGILRGLEASLATERPILLGPRARTVAAMLKGADRLSEPRYRDLALKTLAFIVDRMFSPEKGPDRFLDVGGASVPRPEAGGSGHKGPSHADTAKISLTHDAVELALACLEAHERTADRGHLRAAEAVMGWAMAATWNASSGGFLDSPPEPDAPGYLATPVRSVADNARAAEALIRLSVLTDIPAWREAAEKALQGVNAPDLPLGHPTAAFARAADLLRRGPVEIAILSPAGSKVGRAWTAASLAAPIPRRVVRHLSPTGDEPVLLKKGWLVGSYPSAFVVAGGKASKPIGKIEELEAKLREL